MNNEKKNMLQVKILCSEVRAKIESYLDIYNTESHPLILVIGECDDIQVTRERSLQLGIGLEDGKSCELGRCDAMDTQSNSCMFMRHQMQRCFAHSSHQQIRQQHNEQPQ